MSLSIYSSTSFNELGKLKKYIYIYTWDSRAFYSYYLYHLFLFIHLPYESSKTFAVFIDHYFFG